MVGVQNLACLVKPYAVLRKPLAVLQTPVAILIAGNLLLSACSNIPDACGLGFSHGDCPLFPGETAQFPSDDALCRSYGLRYGSKDYDRCRIAKGSVRAETKARIDTEWWKNPL